MLSVCYRETFIYVLKKLKIIRFDFKTPEVFVIFENRLQASFRLHKISLIFASVGTDKRFTYVVVSFSSPYEGIKPF